MKPEPIIRSCSPAISRSSTPAAPSVSVTPPVPLIVPPAPQSAPAALDLGPQEGVPEYTSEDTFKMGKKGICKTVRFPRVLPTVNEIVMIDKGRYKIIEARRFKEAFDHAPVDLWGFIVEEVR